MTALAYRHQVLRQLNFGTLKEFMELQKQKNALLTANDLTPYTVWAPAFGGLHHMVLEAEFASMAAFETEFAATKAIPELAAINAAQLAFVIPGSAEDRLQRLGLAG